MNLIESVHDPIVRHFSKLKKRFYRKSNRQFIAEGIRTCKTLAAKYQPVAILMTLACYDDPDRPDFNEDVIYIIENNVMNKISTAKTPSGICAIFEMAEHKNLPTEGPGIVLAHLNDPGNMGTIVRTAAAMNILNIICIEGVDPYHPKVVQATTGTIASVNIYEASWKQLMGQNLNLCALTVSGGKTPETIDFKNKFIVLGNEANGLDDEQIQDCQEQLTLPMPGNTESLNAGVAGSIALYLMAQQK